MAREPIIIGSKEFKFQKDALAFFKDMLNSHKTNETIEGEAHYLLIALLARHPEAIQKIGVGVIRFYKFPTEMGTKCFWLERSDGTKTDFSYIAAVKSKRKTLFQAFSEACRSAVREDLIEAKKSFFRENCDENGKVECEVTGKKIAIYESHLDHKSPHTFQVLVTLFIGAKEIEITEAMFSWPQDAQFTTEFLDLNIKENFKSYHDKNADLRIITAGKNLSLGGSERRTRSKRPVRVFSET